MSEETIQRLRGQLQNCVNHLGMMKGRSCAQSERKLDECIESANKALYETLHEAPETIPQDVEEFIAENAVCRVGTNGEEYRTIDEDDFRAWITDHVWRSVEPTPRMMEAVCDRGSYPDFRKMWDAALNASKGE